MNKTGMKRFVRLACQFLAAAFLFLSTGPAVHAQNAQQKYMLKIYGAGTEICDGQSVTPAAGCSLNKGQTDGGVAPTFSFSVTHGTVDPQMSLPQAMGSGFTFFMFTATKVGDAEISTRATDGGGFDKVTVKVEESCHYSYQLWLRLRFTNNFKGTAYTSQDVILAEGTLTPFSPGKRVLGISPLRGSTSPRSVT